MDIIVIYAYWNEVICYYSIALIYWYLICPFYCRPNCYLVMNISCKVAFYKNHLLQSKITRLHNYNFPYFTILVHFHLFYNLCYMICAEVRQNKAAFPFILQSQLHDLCCKWTKTRLHFLQLRGLYNCIESIDYNFIWLQYDNQNIFL